MLNSCIRIYTAHLKQQSTSQRDEITAQFDEMRKQFQDATKCNEGILMIFDANVHVGGEVIKGVTEKQDSGEKEHWKLINDENLVLLNSLELCSGVITRIDPRNGNGSTIDLAICNQFMSDKVLDMSIDESEMYKPTNYAQKIKKTDHNTITLKLKIDRCPKRKPEPYVNLRDTEGKLRFKEFMEETDIDSYVKRSSNNNLQKELDVINELWSDAVNQSFQRITPRRKCKSGISEEVRDLMKEERWVRENVMENPERGRRIALIRKEINVHIEENRNKDVVDRMKMIEGAKCPQSEIFKIRRERNAVQKIGFPLKDKEGKIQVTKNGIDQVVRQHFEKVFKQNPVPEGSIWEEYWKTVDEVFNAISDQKCKKFEPPTFEEIKNIIWTTDDRKSVLGTMKSDLVKLGGDPLIRMIHRFVKMCCEKGEIPDGLRDERMVLLYKNAGPLAELDNYRGIFIRYLILSVLQKWLYAKCSPTVDVNGNEFALGGRKERSVSEVLLIVRLIQDYSEWSKQPLILKFLDITKFFDTMNYKKVPY